jgi:DNA primase
VFRSQQGHERWHCHGCGAGGTAIDLVLAATTLDIKGAIEMLAGRAGVRDDGRDPARHRPVPRPRRAEPRLRDPDGLRRFVDDCARRLWTPAGRPALRWLTEVRRISEDVLRQHRIGADSGRRRQPRPEGMPSAGPAVVLPVLDGGQPVFAQLRPLVQWGPRYVNTSAALAPNPRVALYEPAEPRGSCTLVTEGILDALSAAAGGHRGAALLGAAVPDDETHPAALMLMARLARLDGTLVTALDADDAGALATERLHRLLAANDIAPTRLHLPTGAKDLNEWMQTAADWPVELEAQLRTALACQRAVGIGR